MLPEIEIIDAYKHNLKHISLKIPKNKLVAITGVSGSGKSSLAFDTLFIEGQRRYLESLSSYARQFVRYLEQPEASLIRGIAPTVAIEQKQSRYLSHSTVGSVSEITPFIRLLYAKKSQAFCPNCNQLLQKQTPEKVLQKIAELYKKKRIAIYSVIVSNRRGDYLKLLQRYLLRGYLQALINDQQIYLEDLQAMNRNLRYTIALLIDIVDVDEKSSGRLLESLTIAFNESEGEILIIVDNKKELFSQRFFCPDCNVSLGEPQPATFSDSSALGACSSCSGTGKEKDGSTNCPACSGTGYNKIALSFKIENLNIYELQSREIGALKNFFDSYYEKNRADPVCNRIIPHILQRLEVMIDLHLDYLSLTRRVNTISGGEFQRARLVSLLGQKLNGVIYILDEPSIGMHPREQLSLIKKLKELSKNNSVIVVEHDEDTIKSADYIIDLGPFSGDYGGEIVYQGSLHDFKQAKNSLTSDYVFSRLKVAEITSGRIPRQFMKIKGLSVNNIRQLDVSIPLNCLVVVCGVSGSGKSSLVVNGLFPVISNYLFSKKDFSEPQYKSISVPGTVKDVFLVDQHSIGKNSRSCLATYLGIMAELKIIFSSLSASKMKGFGPERFSFNNPEGYCQSCKGLGVKKITMGFLPDFEVVCPICNGKRFNSEILKIHYNGLSIADVLDLTVEKAADFFKAYPQLNRKFNLLKEVGLSYLRLGQSSTQFSGGESQRLKLCRRLGFKGRSGVLYLFDEPTIGLHADDIKKFLKLIDILISNGNSVIIIEHNIDLIMAADYLIELGPGSGQNGGQIIAEGRLDELLPKINSPTIDCIKKRLANVF